MAKMGQHLILVFALAGLAFGTRPGDFKVLGPGGGGAMFNPTGGACLVFAAWSAFSSSTLSIQK